MKTIFRIALLVIVLASLVGCASQKFEKIGDIMVGDKIYTGLITERVNPFGTNGLTLSLVESDVGQPQQYAPCQQQPRYAPGQLSQEGFQHMMEMQELQERWHERIEAEKRAKCPPPPPPPPPAQSMLAPASTTVSTSLQNTQVNQSVNIEVNVRR